MAKRKKPWSIKQPDGGRWDYIVIGSGMGGMTAAAMLADIGKRVLVLEQHYVPGGFTHSFKRPGFEWDVGVHAVGEVTERSMTGRLLKQLTRGRLQWSSLGEVYDTFTFPGDFRIDFPDNPAQFRENLVEAFPGQAPAIDEFLRTVREVAAGMKSYYMARTLPSSLGGAAVGAVTDRFLAPRAQSYLEQNTDAVLDRITQDDRLRSVLCAQWGYHGSLPSRSSFAIQALVTKHFQWGGYYPVGGSKQIALHLLQTVADAGGWTRIKADVDEILLLNGRAAGVRLKTGEEIRADRVISGAGISATVRRMLPPEGRGSWVREVEALPPAPAHVCLYMGFEGDIREDGASAANQWFYETWRRDADAWHVRPEGGLPDAPILYCSFPSLKDPHHDPGEKVRHTGEIVTFVPWEVFSAWRSQPWKKRGDAYQTFKDRMKEKLLDQFFAHMPGLKNKLVYAELGTPVTTDTFVRPLHGSIYGLEPTPARFRCSWLRPRSPIPGLFFAGSEVATVGVIGAMMGGALAALSAEPRAMVSYLRPVMGR